MISFVLRPFCNDTSCSGCNPTDKIILEVIYVLFFLLWQNLDLTKRKMIHEGPLVWKVNRDKSIGKSQKRVKSLPVGSRLVQFSVSKNSTISEICGSSACVLIKCKPCYIFI